MCTVTYLPLKEGFIFTSNRDERLLRKPADEPQVKRIGNYDVLYPRDGEAGGTWIATNGKGRAICLLNGALHPHIHNPPYKKSRGLVLLDIFESSSITMFAVQSDLKGIEPFTLVVVEQSRLYEFRWDGTDKHFKTIDERKPHIYCSSTLYTPEVIKLRELWFTDWLLMHKEYSVEEILKFHLFAGEGDDSIKIRMSRAGIVKTVSITSIKKQGNDERMYYSDLIEKEGAFDFGVFSLTAQKTQIKLPIPEKPAVANKKD